MLQGIPRSAALLGVAFLLTGCAREIGDDRLTWLWGVAPFALFGLGGAVWVAISRARELTRWDLRSQAVPPDGSGAVVSLSCVAGVVALGFTVLDLAAAGAATSQKVINLVLWCAFSAIAVAIAVFVGRRWAERGYFRGDK